MHATSSLLFLAGVSHVSALCFPSLTCYNVNAANSDTCNSVCKRQGNPNGGRCLARDDGCEGGVCACYPRKRHLKAVDTTQAIIQEYGQENYDSLMAISHLLTPDHFPLDARGIVDERSVEQRVQDIAKRSVCCSLVTPFSGLCCEGHCDKIGKPGGQCRDLGNGEVCSCN